MLIGYLSFNNWSSLSEKYCNNGNKIDAQWTLNKLFFDPLRVYYYVYAFDDSDEPSDDDLDSE